MLLMSIAIIPAMAAEENTWKYPPLMSNDSHETAKRRLRFSDVVEAQIPVDILTRRK